MQAVAPEMMLMMASVWESAQLTIDIINISHMIAIHALFSGCSSKRQPMLLPTLLPMAMADMHNTHST